MRERRTSSISQLFSKTLESINKSSKKSLSRNQNRNNLNNLSPVSSGYGSSTGSSKSLSCSTGKRVMLQQNSGRFIEEIKEENEIILQTEKGVGIHQVINPMKRCTIQPIPKKKSWYQCSTEYESDISEGSDSEYEFYKARRRVPLHRNDIVRLREPLGASQHLSDCVQRPSSKLEAATDQITRLAGFGSSCMREICERKNYEDHLDKVRKEVEKENMRPIRLVPLAGVHQDELRAVRKKIATKGKEAKR